MNDITRADVTLKDIAKLKEDDHFLSAIVDSIPDGILIITSDYRVVACNKAFSSMFQFEQYEFLYSLAPLDTIPNFSNSPTDKILRKTLEKCPTVCEYRVRQRLPRGSTTVLAITVTPLKGVKNLTGAYILLLRDITQLVNYEEKLINLTQYHNIVGSSHGMQQLFTVLKQLATVNTTVLITGESGTGKELVAEALHFGSTRYSGPFVKLNCSALPETMLESELFGHAKGAFSGAVSARKGRFEIADGGTLFLDEIGEASQAIQVKLLRFLESKEFERVGESHTIKSDVRIVTATNADLAAMVEKGTFRRDLYYRLSVMSVAVPPLRERGGDIKLLAEYFLKKYAQEFDRDISSFAAEVLARFVQYDWPGNVRELKNAVEHAVLLCLNTQIQLADLPKNILEQKVEPIASTRSSKVQGSHFSKEAVISAMEEAYWKKTRAAKILGVHRTTLYRLLDRYGIRNR
ncbi:sigma-54 interaction domain-containing protein [Halodesulfovibrio spirochaetisodalis]|uniref:sigma-54 interaction domain-containing protein n=1 Tax=Halodesulfovibrio spirochaetisodalis TaxID=1560234 RepID=UPI00082E7C68|nr:sigma 54-interacting transcriptional regulator [Halodesulfovibrio spirochaetisodalis]